jgi:hypothetical protein
MSTPPAQAAQPPSARSSLARKLLHVAWMSIVLGLCIQGLVMLVERRWPSSLPAELAGKITWSVLVCSAIALGTAAAKAGPAVTGFVGLLAAPMALSAARTVQKTVASAAGGASPAIAAAAPVFVVLPAGAELTIAKAAQYAAFGWLITRVNARPSAGVWAHVAVGALCGGALALYALVRTLTATSQPVDIAWPALIARAVNELCFPIGCAVVVWGATSLSKAASSGAAAERQTATLGA